RASRSRCAFALPMSGCRRAAHASQSARNRATASSGVPMIGSPAIAASRLAALGREGGAGCLCALVRQIECFARIGMPLDVPAFGVRVIPLLRPAHRVLGFLHDPLGTALLALR